MRTDRGNWKSYDLLHVGVANSVPILGSSSALQFRMIQNFLLCRLIPLSQFGLNRTVKYWVIEAYGCNTKVLSLS